MRAVVFDLSVPRYLAAKALGGAFPALYDGAPSCISYREDVPEPSLPGRSWVRLRPILAGVCGSDIATIYFKSAPTLSPYGSFPFVPGHEVVAEVTERGEDVRRVREGDRVVVDPWMHCGLRSAEPCGRCKVGETQVCERAGTGPMRGMLIGTMEALPGGFGERMVAHESQLFPVSSDVSDARAVLAEPLSVGVHAVMRNMPLPGERVLVLGGGAIAYGVLVALDALARDVDVTSYSLSAAQAEMAQKLGATRAWTPKEEPLVERAAKLTSASVLKPVLGPSFLAGGFDRVFDCVGSTPSLRDGMGLSRAGATVVLVGAPGVLDGLDLTHLWSKELHVVGTLGYGFEGRGAERVRTFEITCEILEGSARPIEALVTHHIPLRDFRDALRANLQRERSGAFKTVLVT